MPAITAPTSIDMRRSEGARSARRSRVARTTPSAIAAIVSSMPNDSRMVQLYLTAEYEFSFVQWCWASIMRIVPDLERMTRLCVLAPSPQ